MKGRNQSTAIEFILLGFSGLSNLPVLLFVLVLITYMIILLGNALIVLITFTDPALHTPMYFFLRNLSFLEICYTSVTIPEMLVNLLTREKTISFSSCAAQMYFLISLGGTECCLLTLMAYDRYVAICRPLVYTAIMNKGVCIQLVVGSWITGFLAMIIIIILMSQLIFCGPTEINSFFCDFIPVIKLSCSDLHVLKVVAFICSSVFSVIPFILTLTSYICIIITILRIPSTTGKQKAFSTCSSHLIVVTIYYGTLIIAYMLPKTDTLRNLNKIFSVFYTVVTPLLNPLIYSLRNKEVKEALRKALSKCVAFARIMEM
uniref:Olfactory receptor n=1 Tax=Gopherus evgoodei TaxID=1825980 RepID=A0A8C4WFB2_9SAUR